MPGKAKSLLFGSGLVVMCVGLLCMPLALGVSPKRDTSAFHRIASTGTFLKVGFLGIGVGVTLMALSLLVPRDKKRC